jgi:hypothetical protein
MGVRPFRPIATCSPSSANDSYIYSIVPTSNNALAIISSSDELAFLDRAGLKQIFSFSSPKVPTGVTCLQSGDQDGNVLLCAGRDGSVVAFDIRSQSNVSYVKLGMYFVNEIRQGATRRAQVGGLSQMPTEFSIPPTLSVDYAAVWTLAYFPQIEPSQR